MLIGVASGARAQSGAGWKALPCPPQAIRLALFRAPSALFPFALVRARRSSLLVQP
jgi:hypothetical protein